MGTILWIFSIFFSLVHYIHRIHCILYFHLLHIFIFLHTLCVYFFILYTFCTTFYFQISYKCIKIHNLLIVLRDSFSIFYLVELSYLPIYLILTFHWSSIPTSVHIRHDFFSYFLLILNNVVPSLQLISRGHYRNFGLRYEYTVPKKEPDRAPEYSWVLSDWSLCTATCGGGTQTSKALCNEKKSGVVEDHFCESIERPESILRECNLNPCPAR